MQNQRRADRQPALYLLATLLFGAIAAARLPAASPPDFAAARDEAVATLQALIRVDSSNPPGNETAVATLLAKTLAADAIDSQIYALEPSRGNLVARLSGNGSKRPILLMAHSDVVGVERDKWSVDPFAAEIADGYVYGRGATDDKGMLAAIVEVMRLLKRQGLELDRDVILLAEAGEEGTTTVGIDFMVEQHWDAIDCEIALNEGGGMRAQGGVVGAVMVATTEKVPRGMRVIARGTSGHGSIPRPDNPVVHLAAAVAKIGAYQPPMRLNETTGTYFQRLAAISPPELAFLYTHLDDPDIGALVQEKLRTTDILSNSLLRTTISPNIMKGGFRSNVIPAEAEATLDIRALPDEDIEGLADTLERLVDDPLVEIVRPPARGRPLTPPSRLDNALFLALEKAQRELFPKAVTLPFMLTAATDSAQLRARGVQAYGIGPPTEGGEIRAHGNDERIGVEALGQFVEYIYRAVTAVAVKGGGS